MKLIIECVCNNLLHFVRGRIADGSAHQSSRAGEFLKALSTSLRSDDDIMAWLQQHCFEQVSNIEFMPLRVQRDDVQEVITVVPIKAGYVEFIQRNGWHIEEKRGEFFLPLNQPKLSTCCISEFTCGVSGEAAHRAAEFLCKSGLLDCLVPTRKFACGNLLLRFQMLCPELPSGKSNPDFDRDHCMTWIIKIGEGQCQKEMRICWVDNKAALLPWSPTGCGTTRQRMMMMEPTDFLQRFDEGSASPLLPALRCPKRNVEPCHSANVPTGRAVRFQQALETCHFEQVDLSHNVASPRSKNALRQRCRGADDALALCGGLPSSQEEWSAMRRSSRGSVAQDMERAYRKGNSKSMPGLHRCRRSSCRSTRSTFRQTLSGIEEVASSRSSEQPPSRSSETSSQRSTRLSKYENLRRPMRGSCDMHI